MTKRKEKPAPTILSESDEEFFVAHTELFGRFILFCTNTSMSFRGIAWRYTELDTRYAEYMSYYMTDEKGMYPFPLEEGNSTSYIPTEALSNMVLLVEMIIPDAKKH